MKIRVTLTVEVDPEAWWTIYGVGRDELREDVRGYIHNQVASSAAADERAITDTALMK